MGRCYSDVSFEGGGRGGGEYVYVRVSWRGIVFISTNFTCGYCLVLTKVAE